jgi:hypothetical protein
MLHRSCEVLNNEGSYLHSICRVWQTFALVGVVDRGRLDAMMNAS